MELQLAEGKTWARDRGDDATTLAWLLGGGRPAARALKARRRIAAGGTGGALLQRPARGTRPEGEGGGGEEAGRGRSGAVPACEVLPPTTPGERRPPPAPPADADAAATSQPARSSAVPGLTQWRHARRRGHGGGGEQEAGERSAEEARALSAAAFGVHAGSAHSAQRGASALQERHGAFPRSAAAAEARGGDDSGAGPDELLTPSQKRRAAAVVAVWRRQARVAPDAASDRDSTEVHPIAAAPGAAATQLSASVSDAAGAGFAPVGETAIPEGRAGMVQGQVVGGGEAGGASAADVLPDDTPPATEDILAWSPAANSVAEALYVRLCRAISGGEDYHVSLVVPVHPDGPIKTVRAIQLVLFWEQVTMARGHFSLLQRLRRRYPGVDLGRYISVLCLRNYGVLADGTTPVTEQVYVHSKCLIADDRLAIIGSANINECVKGRGRG